MKPPVVLVLPGAAGFEIEPTSEGVHLKCKGCGTEYEFQAAVGEISETTIHHEEDCPVFLAIRRASQAGRS